jgi:hypothetical protein
MAMVIDGVGNHILINYETIPKMSYEKLIELWHQTGYLFVSDNEYNTPKYRKLSFNEWLETLTQ